MDESLDFESRFVSALKGVGRAPVPRGIAEDDPTEEIETDEGDEGGEKVAASVRAPTTINLFQHPDAHTIVLDLALLRKYGPEWFTWEPETLEWRIPQDFRTSGVSELNMSKIQAAKTLHFVDSYWKQWEVFIWCTMPFNGVYPDFEVLQPPTVAQALVSVDIANRIRTDVEWSEEVKGFFEVVFRHEGIFCPQPPLDFVEIDAEGLIVDCAEVSALWPKVRASGHAPTEDTATAEQLRRSLTVYQYLEESRELLKSQLPMVLNA